MLQTFVFGQKPVIGKHTLANYSKEVARAHGYEDWALYTGHSCRRTTVTLAADSGMSLAQIKQITGHKSDTVVQGYIDNSDEHNEQCEEIINRICQSLRLWRRAGRSRRMKMRMISFNFFRHLLTIRTTCRSILVINFYILITNYQLI
jgi:hypothetical protein